MIGGIATKVAGVAPREESFEIVEREPQLVERRARKRFGKEFVNGVSDGGGTADLHRVGHIKVVATVLRNHFYARIHRAQVYISEAAESQQIYLL